SAHYHCTFIPLTGAKQAGGAPAISPFDPPGDAGAQAQAEDQSVEGRQRKASAKKEAPKHEEALATPTSHGR
ncbi:MAG: hypothetical protein KAI06_02785, partial [Anaerolineales bacterium]|nr:hypothetical protein [Anaerolineales bacterium]